MSDLLAVEIWAAFRPYAKVLILDLAVAISLWSLLAVFKWVTQLIKIEEPAGAAIGTIHSYGVVCVFGILAGSLVWDIIQLKRAEGRRK